MFRVFRCVWEAILFYANEGVNVYIPYWNLFFQNEDILGIILMPWSWGYGLYVRSCAPPKKNWFFFQYFGGGHFVLCKSGSPSQKFSWEHHFSERGQPKEHFDTHFIEPWGVHGSLCWIPDYFTCSLCERKCVQWTIPMDWLNWFERLYESFLLTKLIENFELKIGTHDNLNIAWSYKK